MHTHNAVTHNAVARTLALALLTGEKLFGAVAVPNFDALLGELLAVGAPFHEPQELFRHSAPKHLYIEGGVGLRSIDTSKVQRHHPDGTCGTLSQS